MDPDFPPGTSPPDANASVLLQSYPTASYLAKVRLFYSYKQEPVHYSVPTESTELANQFLLSALSITLISLFNSETSVQLVPFQDTVYPERDGSSGP